MKNTTNAHQSISTILQTTTCKVISILNPDEMKQIKGGWITNTDLDQV